MAIEQVAIIISIFSAGVALISIGWNIYRDVILKAKVRVTFGIRIIIHDTMPGRPKFVAITATNFGPGTINLSMIQAKHAPLWRRIFRKVEYAVIMYDYTNLMSTRLPAKVEPGDRIDLFLPYDVDCLLNREWTHVGIDDYFGRHHWAPRKQIKKARKEWLEEFSNET